MNFSKYYFSLLNSFQSAILKRKLSIIYKGPIKKHTYNILLCLLRAGVLLRVQHNIKANSFKIYFNYNKISYPGFRKLQFISTNTLQISLTFNQLIFLHKQYPLDLFILYTSLGFLTIEEAISKKVSGILVLKILY